MHCSKYSRTAEEHALPKKYFEGEVHVPFKICIPKQQKSCTVQNILEQQKILYCSRYPKAAEGYAPRAKICIYSILTRVQALLET
jgi:hypothetical protein